MQQKIEIFFIISDAEIDEVTLEKKTHTKINPTTFWSHETNEILQLFVFLYINLK